MSLQGGKNLKIPALIATLVLLAALAVEAQFRPRPATAEPYHQQVRQAVLATPETFDSWRGSNQAVPKAAQQLLKPNIIYSRRFHNEATGQNAGVLVVHCKDARDLRGHYPPVCYPAHGQTERERMREASTIEVGGVQMPYMIYHFAGNRAGENLTVYNFIIVPGEVCRDMEAVDDRVGDYTRRFYGAAQLQVVFQGDRIEPAEQDQIFRQMLEHHLPIVEAIRAGGGQ